MAMTFMNQETFFRAPPNPKDLPSDFSCFLEAPSLSSSQSPALQQHPLFTSLELTFIGPSKAETSLVVPVLQL